MTSNDMPVRINAFAVAFFENAQRTVLQAFERLIDQ
jgi:hypothetical protein